jgi:hypothetical protein
MDDEAEKQKEFEQLAEDRRRSADQLVWQVPGLSVAAQAFLYSRALDPNTSATARLLVAIVGLCTALATAQLLLKHRYHEAVYANAIDAARNKRGLEPLGEMKLFKTRAEDVSTADYQKWMRLRRVVELPATGVWIATIAVFALVDLFVGVVAVLELFQVWDPF